MFTFTFSRCQALLRNRRSTEAMPSFIDTLSLRRKSKASFKVAEIDVPSPDSTSLSNDGSNDKPSTQRNKSSSTLSSFFGRAHLLHILLDASLDHKPPFHGHEQRLRPWPYTTTNPETDRDSRRVTASDISASPATETEPATRQTPATSPWAPRVLSVSDGSWVHQKVLLIFGQCADPQQPLDGTLTVHHHQNNFPAQQWPVNDSHFKALVCLQPGPNRLRLEFTSPRLQAPGSNNAHTSWIHINYLPLNDSPPIQLCILLAKDSDETYDAVPERVAKEGNDLAMAIKKFRLCAYLWQAFTAEQMHRQGFGRRCYRYEEEWQLGTLAYKDSEAGTMRNEAKIHVIRLDKTVAEIRDLDLAQQYEGAKRNGELYSIAYDAVLNYFRAQSGRPQYVSCMFMDTKWDKDVGTVRGHAALGGGDDTIKLAIFGSHCLQSYPAHLDEVVPAFSDCTRTDTNHVANDCGEAGSSWEAANIGIGAHLHETGHLLGCPHQESGVMLRDYTTFNRTFVTREPYSTRTRQPGQRLILPQDECEWHRLDTLRFRYHPCFRIPNDPATTDTTTQVWGVENNSILVTNQAGIAWIEFFPEGDDECHHWIEYSEHGTTRSRDRDSDYGPNGPPKQVTLSDQTIKDRLPAEKRGRKLRIDIFSCNGERHEVKDVYSLYSKEARYKLPDGRPGFKSSKLGSSAMEGSQPQEMIFSTAWKQKEPLLSVRIYHGAALDGMEFFYEGGKRLLFGKRGGKEGGDDFALNIWKGETIIDSPSALATTSMASRFSPAMAAVATSTAAKAVLCE
ncbi:hypothetical protein AMS68_005647 [Peltaster fructicola]|uniref:Jacalin-type lectin domain-containing protein n=1 Tax=Peltaster fructicola TaxID=286661 RepID=A0A6H0Y0F6_9PEZI|nr:hypothetical protein AMS68_005647 [Peltaster fructicola]